ncbi:MAG: putative glycoside hydrolase [bacterium]
MKTGKAVLIFLVISSFLLVSYNPPGTLQSKYETGRIEKENFSEETESDTRSVPKDNIARRLLLEQNRRGKQGDLYVPLPAGPRVFDTSAVKARGIYVTGNTAGHSGRFRELLHLVETTELNSMVINVKNDHGRLTYPSNIDFVQEIGADNSPPVSNLRALVNELNNRGIYTIARLVVFRDPYLAEKKPGWAIQNSSGDPWYDGSGKAWMNPYREELWRYNVAIAREAALLGFDEIQFDYIRFPALSAEKRKNLHLPGKDGRRRDEVIGEFLKFANLQLEDYKVKISADLFGIATSRWDEANNIGQSWAKIAPHVDYKSPMIYPSHYQNGYFNFKVPDANPAATVEKALQAALKKNKKIDNPAKLRPWLQGFTAHWLTGNINYGPRQIRQQIEATRELGIDEYLIWNSSNRYNRNAFIRPEARRSEAGSEESTPEG